MSTIDKLIERMLTKPKDFDEADLDKVLAHFHYRKRNAKSGGSGLKYVREDGSILNFHSPHSPKGEKSLKEYVVKDTIDELKKRGLIK